MAGAGGRGGEDVMTILTAPRPGRLPRSCPSITQDRAVLSHADYFSHDGFPTKKYS